MLGRPTDFWGKLEMDATDSQPSGSHTKPH